MATTAQNTSNSKFHVNVLTTVGKIANTNTEQQMRGQVYNSNRLQNASKGLGNLSEAMGNLDTDASGFSVGGKIALALGVVAVAAVGLGLSCLFGPEMEVAADAVDAAVVGGIEGFADVEATAEVVDASVDVTSRVLDEGATTFKNGKKMTTQSVKVDGSKVNLRAEMSPDGSMTHTTTIKKDGYTNTVVEFSPTDGEANRTSTFTKKAKISKAGLGLSTMAIGGSITLATGLNGSKKTNQANEFTKSNTMLNNGASQLNTGMETVGAAYNQEESAIQSNENMFSAALSSVQSIGIPPVGA